MTEITKSVLGLATGSRYALRVRAVNAFGVVSDWSEALVVAVSLDNATPGVPAGLRVVANPTSINLQWNANLESSFDHYEVYVSDVNNFVPAPASLYGSVTGTVLTITTAFDPAANAMVPLTPGGTYYIRMRAVSQAGIFSDYSGIVSAVLPIVGSTDASFGTITGNAIIANTLSASAITSSNLTATIGLIGTIKTSDTGARVVIGKEDDSSLASDTGIFAYANDGSTELLAYRQSTGNLTIQANIAGGTIDIGGADNSSFHVDASGNVWSGAATLAAAPFAVTGAGVVTLNATGVDINGTNASGLTLGVTNGAGRLTLSGTTVTATSATLSIPAGAVLVGTTGVTAPKAGQVVINKTNQTGSWDNQGLIVQDVAGGAVASGLTLYLPGRSLAGVISFNAFGPFFGFQNFNQSSYYSVVASAFNVNSTSANKRTVRTLKLGTDTINSLRPVRFKRPSTTDRHPVAAKNEDSYRCGFMVDDVVKQFPEAVHWTADDKEKPRAEAIDYAAIVAVLVKSVQELSGRLDNLEGYLHDRRTDGTPS